MSASGKSSHRLSEWNRGYFTRSGHGPYALAGRADRKRHDELAAQSSDRSEDPGQDRDPPGRSIMEYQDQEIR